MISGVNLALSTEANAKERITVAMKGETPDCVPVTLGLSEAVPVRYFTDDFLEFFWIQKLPLWRARVETEHDRFGADSFLHLVPGTSPDDPPVEIVDVKELPDEVHYTQVVRTAKGDLAEDFCLGRKFTRGKRSHAVKSPEDDAGKVLETLKHPDSKDLDEMLQAYREIGDRAHVGLWLPVPIEWWVGFRGGQEMIMDFYDCPELMERLFAAYAEYAVALIDHVFANSPLDSLGLGGSSTSMSLISPDLHRQYTLPFGRKVCAASHRHGRPVQYHMCGRSRQALPITAEMGVDGFDALESPPTGNVDLAEVKKTFGHKISLRGNVNSITVMGSGDPEDVRRDVGRCMDAAKAGGGYILGVGDQTPYETPEENLFAFVEAGRALGKY